MYLEKIAHLKNLSIPDYIKYFCQLIQYEHTSTMDVAGSTTRARTNSEILPKHYYTFRKDWNIHGVHIS